MSSDRGVEMKGHPSSSFFPPKLLTGIEQDKLWERRRESVQNGRQLSEKCPNRALGTLSSSSFPGFSVRKCTMSSMNPTLCRPGVVAGRDVRCGGARKLRQRLKTDLEPIRGHGWVN